MNAKSVHGWDKAAKPFSAFRGNAPRLELRNKIIYHEVHLVSSKVEKSGTKGRMQN